MQMQEATITFLNKQRRTAATQMYEQVKLTEKLKFPNSYIKSPTKNVILNFVPSFI